MNNYSYVTLLTSDNYVQGVVLLKASLDKVGAKYPLTVMVTDNLKEKTTNILNSLGVNIIPIKRIATPKSLYERNKKLDPRIADVWKDVLTKFQVWTLTQYDKIIMLDCDLMFLKNVDDCFEKPEMTAALDGEYFNLWGRWPHFNTGFFVVKPSKETYDKIVDFATNMNKYVNIDEVVDHQGNPYVIADQELLNLYFNDWKDKPELHLNKYYNIFSPHIATGTERDIAENAYFIHFTGDKPWFINEEHVSILRTKAGWNYLTCYFLEEAAAMIEVMFNNEFKVDWSTVSFDEFTMMEAALAVYRFRDYKNAKVFLGRIDPDTLNENLLSDYKELYQITLAAERSVHIQPLLEYMYKEKASTRSASIELYKYLAINEKMLDFPEDYLVPLSERINTLYDEIFAAIEKLKL